MIREYNKLVEPVCGQILFIVGIGLREREPIWSYRTLQMVPVVGLG